MDPWIYANDITWMEKTVSSPYWTGLTLFSVSTMGRPKLLLHEKMYQGKERVGFKGQVFGAPMDWERIHDQLEAMEQERTHIMLPWVGAELA